MTTPWFHSTCPESREVGGSFFDSFCGLYAYKNFKIKCTTILKIICTAIPSPTEDLCSDCVVMVVGRDLFVNTLKWKRTARRSTAPCRLTVQWGLPLRTKSVIQIDLLLVCMLIKIYVIMIYDLSANFIVLWICKWFKMDEIIVYFNNNFVLRALSETARTLIFVAFI